MPETRLIKDVIGTGARLAPHEAVAIVQQLIASVEVDVELTPPLGPPSLDTVHLGSDGSVVCSSCTTRPAVFEIAIFLEAMLPRGGPTPVPGALRYTMARAMLEVDAPPFDSIDELSAVLKRHEKGDRTVVLRELYARARAAAASRVIAFPGDRRRRGPQAAELRRQLRQADEELYGRLIADPPIAGAALASAPAPPAIESRAVEVLEPGDIELVQESRVEPPRERRGLNLRRWALSLAAAAFVAFGVGYTATDFLTSRAPSAPVIASTADAPASQTAAPPALPAAPSVPLEAAVSAPPAVSVTLGVDDALAAPQRAARSTAGPEPSVIRAVAPTSGPTFSPSFDSNGTALFFHTGRSSDTQSAIEAADLAGDLRVMSIVDDGARNYHVQPSQDGTRVAFDSDRDGERGVYVANRDGTGVTRVSGPGYAAVPTWSPDGTQLAIVRAESDRPHVWNLWLLTLETGEGRRLTRFRYGQTWSASWFADGKRIAYTHEDRLIVLDLAASVTRQFESPLKGRLVRTAAVSPDGNHVIFQVARSGAWLLDLRDGTMRCVLTDPTAEEFAWSPDGRRVAFHSRRDGQWGIWIMAPA
jgi:hypothetical protein